MPRTDERRVLRGGALAVGALWLPLLLLAGDVQHLVTYDDAWYYLQIGRNIADGAGSTFDGLNTTNGYHPLWMGIVTAVYALGFDDVAAVRAVLVVQLALWVGLLWLLADMVADAIAGWPRLVGRSDRDTAGRRGTFAVAALLFVLGANPYVFKLFVNGMETGVAALAGIALLRLAVRRDGDPLTAPLAATALAALVFLSRTDSVFLIASLFLWTAIVRRRIDRQILLTGTVFAVVVLAYLGSNVLLVGHPMQISGEVKRAGLDADGAVSAALTFAAAFGVFLLGVRVPRSGADAGRFPRARTFFAATAWWPAGALALLAYEWGFTKEIYLWHYAPQVLWVVIVLPHLLADLVEGTTLERSDDDPAAVRRASLAAGILLLPFVAGGLWQLTSFVDPEISSMQLRDRAAAEWIAANLPGDAVVASSDAGVIGYFAERPVVNIDGLVNSYEWDEARHVGTAATAAFLRASGVTHVANHGDPVDGDDPELRDLIDRLLGDEAGAEMVLIHREDYVFSGGAGGRSGRRPYATFVYELP